jgi:hypothetical protein
MKTFREIRNINEARFKYGTNANPMEVNPRDYSKNAKASKFNVKVKEKGMDINLSWDGEMVMYDVQGAGPNAGVYVIDPDELNFTNLRNKNDLLKFGKVLAKEL